MCCVTLTQTCLTHTYRKWEQADKLAWEQLQIRKHRWIHFWKIIMYLLWVYVWKSQLFKPPPPFLKYKPSFHCVHILYVAKYQTPRPIKGAIFILLLQTAGVYQWIPVSSGCWRTSPSCCLYISHPMRPDKENLGVWRKSNRRFTDALTWRGKLRHLTSITFATACRQEHLVH